MLSSRRAAGQRPWALLLPVLFILTRHVEDGTCSTDSHSCPRSLDCAQAGRHFCQPGSSICGPCLWPLVENSQGRCKKRHIPHYGKMTTYPQLDQEIDFLSTIISEQRETESRLPALLANPKEEELHVAQPSHKPTTEQPMIQSALSTTTNHTPAIFSDPMIIPYPSSDHFFIILSSVFAGAGSLALVVAGVCWVRLQRDVRLSQKVDYPAYGLMKAHSFDSSVPGDKKLARSAQMYHYQHQKQQMLSLERHRDQSKVPDSGATSDEENEDGDFTVYECPGLAPTGEMEVRNPLFDDSTLYLQRSRK
ncbi:neural proliferation differentiation and control protein 1 [Lampris incognitus]|uniref:neural proliferation differentiation and control protein 1 n=1 Tax=Lampris incognitus TaxID=2546036 RepID=UPI0024B633E8|nr:neural proliferation differentiation and control protein 1 [Lampris incognitus]